MIINPEKQIDEEQHESESPLPPPPAYADAVGSAPAPTNWGKTPTRETRELPVASTSRPRPPTPPRSSFTNAAAWFTFGALSKTDKEIKATVLGLIRDIVRQTPGPAGVSIFQSCAEACRARNLQFDVLLQERSIEGHTPLYWTILKRKSTDQLGLLDLLLSFPLSDDTRADASLACMLQSDNDLFQRLQQSPGWKQSFASGADEMLLGSLPEDSVKVEDIEGSADKGAFKADFYFPEFQQRMRVSRAVQIEFIARERLWAFTFSRDPLTGTRRRKNKRSWQDPSSGGYVGVTILDESPATPFSGRIVIDNVKNPSKPPMIIVLKSGADELKPSRWQGDSRGVCSVPLAATPDGPSLQHTGSSYVDEQNGLRFKLEAKLARDDTECRIM